MQAFHRGDLVGAQVDEREAVVSRQGIVASDNHPQVPGAERLVGGRREGKVDRLDVGRVQGARGGAIADPGKRRVLRGARLTFSRDERLLEAHP